MNTSNKTEQYQEQFFQLLRLSMGVTEHNRRLQRWLNMELINTESVEEGFNVPSVRFALAMQLSHIQHHFFRGGIGLRQVCDYYMLLKNSTEKDRRMVADYLTAFGLRQIAGGTDVGARRGVPDGSRADTLQARQLLRRMHAA